ncbi:hypothetical protein ACWE42_13385 [Sutcliffiella cohnii]
MASIIKKSFYLLMEVNLLFTFVLISYIHIPYFPPIEGILLPVLLAIFIYSFLEKTMKVQTFVLIVFFAPILSIISFAFGYSFILSVVIGSTISWRAFVVFIHGRQLLPRTIFLLTIFWIMFVYFFAVLDKYKYADYLLYLLGFQLLFFLLSRLADSFQRAKVDYTLKGNILKGASYFVGTITIAIIFLSTFGRVIISEGLKSFGWLIGFLFGVLAQPFLYLLSLIDWEYAAVELGEQSSEDEESDVEKWMQEFRDPEAFWDNVIVMAIIFLIIFIVALIYLRKVKVKRLDVEDDVSYNTKTNKWRRKNEWWQKPPKDEVRKLVFDLEKLAYKKGRGRKRNETLEEWLVRESILSEQFFTLYEKVRYGELHLTENEIILCKELAKEIRETIKKWEKF